MVQEIRRKAHVRYGWSKSELMSHRICVKWAINISTLFNPKATHLSQQRNRQNNLRKIANNKYCLDAAGLAFFLSGFRASIS